MRAAAAALGLFLGAAGPASLPSPFTAPTRAPAHPNSFSISEIHVRGETIELHLRCQVLSLAEVLETFDPDLDGRAEDGEVAANAAAIAGYVAAHYRFVAGAADSAAASDAGAALAPIASDVSESPLALDPMNEVSEWIDVKLKFAAPRGDVERLGVHVDLFQATSPGHRDSAAVVWNGLELGAWQFAQQSEAHLFVPTEEMLARNEPALARYGRRGLSRALRAWDVVLLLALIVLGARAARSSVAVAGGLALAAILAGALAAPNIVFSPQHVRFLELTVPLALGYVALDDLLHREGRTRVLEPLVFGAVLGAREVVALAPDLATEAATGPPTLGFAAGLVGGLGSIWALALLLPRGRGADESRAFAPRTLRSGLDLVALALAAWGFWSVFRG